MSPLQKSCAKSMTGGLAVAKQKPGWNKRGQSQSAQISG
jgi:hypothetical protein